MYISTSSRSAVVECEIISACGLGSPPDGAVSRRWVTAIRRRQGLGRGVLADGLVLRIGAHSLAEGDSFGNKFMGLSDH